MEVVLLLEVRYAVDAAPRIEGLEEEDLVLRTQETEDRPCGGKAMTKYFFFGSVRSAGSLDDQDRMTKGKDSVVVGGNEKDHKETVEITRLLEEGVKMDGVHHAPEILRDAIKKVKG